MNAAEATDAPGGDAPGSDAPIRVLVVDDHDLFRIGLVSLLRSQPDIEVVGQTSRGLAGVRLAGELQPDIVLMDLTMADLPGTEATRMIVERCPSIRVLALGVLARNEDVTGAVVAGASGYLHKDTRIEEVATAVRVAANGGAWLSPHAAKLVLEQLRQSRSPWGEPSSVEKLSPRQLAVLRLIAQGMGNAEIAATLNISPRTAKNHVSAILTKLGLPNRLHVAIYAVRRGLDEPPGSSGSGLNRGLREIRSSLLWAPTE